jgi:DNA-directed RNA polymerase subunit RPC12/RpoP
LRFAHRRNLETAASRLIASAVSPRDSKDSEKTVRRLTNTAAPFDAATLPPPRRLFARLACLVFGHGAHNRAFAAGEATVRRCSCGSQILGEGGGETHVRHNLACFFLGHNYTLLAARDGYQEYACTACGHPLLFEAGTPYAQLDTFHKQVRYRCGLFGHRVRRAGRRHGLTEYACHCGHSFLQDEEGRTKVRHPLGCVLAGHLIYCLGRRDGCAEYRCRRCGHTFCFALPG